MPASAKGALPNLVIIGAQKAGTTSLHFYLNQHPEIGMSHEKELYFFSHRSPQDEEWYRAQFDPEYKIRGEASPQYTYYPEVLNVPLKMSKLIPEARLIYVLRDPFERIISHYVHDFSYGKETRPFETCLENLSDNTYIDRSRYYTQIEQYLPYYDPSRIIILTAEDLCNKRAATMQTTFRFLGVDPEFHSPHFAEIKHSTSVKGQKNLAGKLLKQLSEIRLAKIIPTHARMTIGEALYRPFSTPIQRPVLDEDTRSRIAEHLGPDLLQLRSFSGRNFSEWSISV